MICIACKELCLPQPDSLIEKCDHCGEHVCADRHIARYVNHKPVCNICIAWVCDECGTYAEEITIVQRRTYSYRYCPKCQTFVVMRGWKERQAAAGYPVCRECGDELDEQDEYDEDEEDFDDEDEDDDPDDDG